MQNHTTIYTVADGYRNVWKIDIKGNKGSGAFVRATWPSAVGTARLYARILDAPRGVI